MCSLSQSLGTEQSARTVSFYPNTGKWHYTHHPHSSDEDAKAHRGRSLEMQCGETARVPAESAWPEACSPVLCQAPLHLCVLIPILMTMPPLTASPCASCLPSRIPVPVYRQDTETRWGAWSWGSSSSCFPPGNNARLFQTVTVLQNVFPQTSPSLSAFVRVLCGFFFFFFRLSACVYVSLTTRALLITRS